MAPFPAGVAKVAGASGIARRRKRAPPAAFATHRKRVLWTPSRGPGGWEDAIPLTRKHHDYHEMISMSLLGLDIGTSGCKAVAFDLDGRIIALAYEEYDPRRPQPGWAELDTAEVWGKIRAVLRKVAAAAADDLVQAISFSSLGEAVVPVSADRRILGPSILCIDARGAEYVEPLAARVPAAQLYRINGNSWGNHYSVTKLMWMRDNCPELYRAADKFLLWGSFVPFMLGAEAAVDFSLANRTLLFDLARRAWSAELLNNAGLDPEKLPVPVPSGSVIGQLSRAMAAELGLPAGIPLVAGAHDQCANAVGCGVTDEGRAMYGLGSFICAVPVFRQRVDAKLMLPRGLCTEHHAVKDRFVSFIYNQGGILLKWCRDTFAAAECRQARTEGRDVYATLMQELPPEPGRIMVLPHFTATGPPDFVTRTSGVIAGLHLDSSRGAVIKGVIEGMTYYLRECLDALPAAGIHIRDFRAVGGGSKSDAWLQLSADIMGRPFVRPKVTEAGALGAAILAGTGCGVYPSVPEAAARLVVQDRVFEPNPERHALYSRRFEQYRKLFPLLRDYLAELDAAE